MLQFQFKVKIRGQGDKSTAPAHGRTQSEDRSRMLGRLREESLSFPVQVTSRKNSVDNSRNSTPLPVQEENSYGCRTGYFSSSTHSLEAEASNPSRSSWATTIGSQLASFEQEHWQLLLQFRATHEELQRVKDLNSSYKKIIAKLEREKNSWKEESNTLKSDLEKANQEINQLNWHNQEHLKLERKFRETMERDKNDREEEIRKLKVEMKKHENALSEAKVAIADFERKEKRNYKNYDDNLETMTAFEELRNQVRNLTKERDEFKAEFSASKDEINSLKQMLELAKKELRQETEIHNHLKKKFGEKQKEAERFNLTRRASCSNASSSSSGSNETIDLQKEPLKIKKKDIRSRPDTCVAKLPRRKPSYADTKSRNTSTLPEVKSNGYLV